MTRFNRFIYLLSCYLLLGLWPHGVEAKPRLLQEKLSHLRIEGEREWDTFPDKPDATSLTLTFSAKKNQTPFTLRLRQQDIKQTWDVRLNGKDLARLIRDENDMIVYFSIARGMLRDGDNTLAIEPQKRAPPDDVRIGEVWLDPRPISEVLSESSITLEVRDARSGAFLPARLTILSNQGASLQSVGAESNDHRAVRPGTLYTSTGKATFGLPAGDYTIYAGRGFEYSLASVKVSLRPGESTSKQFTLRREVPTEGYVACDTHVHSLTHSGHGDATVEERMITLAAEGIELPIATDHNVHIDHGPFAKAMKVRQYFTPVIGNEVTTRVGHFNIFPVQPGAKIPDYRSSDWKTIFAEIYKTPGVKICILNHARDLHSGVRPLGPKWHNALVGQNLDGRLLQANAMEVVNSAAIQTDPLQLFHDWMALLNRGHLLTPVGASDSHDVARHFVGQGRTYIRCDDRDPGNIPIAQAVNHFIQGQVMVSYGLAVEMTVETKYHSGELAHLPDDTVHVEARVLGPHWTRADRIELFANGKKIREEKIPEELRDLPVGVKWQGGWVLDRPEHDVHLVAIATGPGVEGLYWKTAKPYQPMSSQWTPRVIGCSGAIWLDGDSNGRPTPAYDYARQLVAAAGNDLPRLFTSLAGYDRAVAAQAASLYAGEGTALSGVEFETALKKASREVREGFLAYRAARRACEIARSSAR
jgi:hypothetical protein